MRSTISTELLSRLLQATPEQYAAVESILGMAGCHRPGGRRHLTPALSPIEAEREKAWGRDDYVLRRVAKGWMLVFAGAETFLPDLKGVKSAEYLLKNPPVEPIHATELAGKACGELVIEGQRNLGLEDRETLAAKRKARLELQAVIDDPEAGEVERREAEADLAEIDAWALKAMRGTEAGEQRQARAVRQTLRRLIERLETATDAFGRPDLVQRAFGEHLRQHMWVPSGRGGWGRNARVRAGLAGRFTYEPPEGVRWRG